MKKSSVLLGAAAVLVVLTTSVFADDLAKPAPPADRGATFTGVGFHPEPGPYPSSAVWSMNPQGTIFMTSPSYFGNYCFEWTREQGWGTEVGQSYSVCQISKKGTIMGEGLVPGSDPAYLSAGTWAGAPNVWNPIPFPNDYAPCGLEGISFYDMGGNGEFATGLTWYGSCKAGAFRWDKKTNTTVNLGSPSAGSGRGNAISDDGKSVVGWGEMLFGTWRGARWDEARGGHDSHRPCPGNDPGKAGGDPQASLQPGVGGDPLRGGGHCGGNSSGWSWIDGQGDISPKVCNVTGKACTFDGDDPVYGCPQEYVDDSYCTLAECVADVCDGGPNAGNSCTPGNFWECPGYCVGGPNAGGECDQDYYCPDTPVCVANPAWSDAAFKGEARDISAKGHVVGKTFSYDYTTPQYLSGWRQNPDGSFTEIPTAPSFPDVWEPFRVSAGGETVVGMIGNPFFGAIAAFWNEKMGTQDLQLFLVQQGLDELFFWFLPQLNDVSADGTVIAGTGFNPDGFQEGFIVDMKQLWVCHVAPGRPPVTTSVKFKDVGKHLEHGDFLGTCEFLNANGLARASALRARLNRGFTVDPNRTGRVCGGAPDSDLLTRHEGPSSRDLSYGRQLRAPSPTGIQRPGVQRRPMKVPAPTR